MTEKKCMLTYSFFCFAHLQKAPITATSENVPGSRCSAHGEIFFLFLSNKTFQVFTFENIDITKSYIIIFLVNIWNHGKNFILQDLIGRNPC